MVDLIQSVVEGVLLVAAVVLAMPVATLAAQVWGALVLRGSKGRGGAGPTGVMRRNNVAVLMPAHDEATGIVGPIAAVLSQLLPGDRLLVVADNCSDRTAAVATAAGAEVVERHDAAHRGKGYALDFGVRHLSSEPPDFVVIVDADCIVAPGALEQIVAASAGSGRPVQSLYLMRSPPGAPLTTRIAEFAWLFKNQVRATGFHRLGLPCPLMGSGMAFPWALISAVPLASGHIVEDLQLGLELTAEGTPPLFCPHALVSSVFPSTRAGLATQRTRWEHGHIGVILEVGPRLLWMAIRRGRWALAAMVLDLCVPPLAGLAMAMLLVVAASAVLAATGGALAPLLVAAVTLVVWTLSVGAAWRAFGSNVLTLRELASIPAYVARKIPGYLRLFRRRETEWIRTERDDGKH